MIETAILYFFVGMTATLIGVNWFISKKINKNFQRVKLIDGTEMYFTKSFVYPDKTWITMYDNTGRYTGYMYVEDGHITELSC